MALPASIRVNCRAPFPARVKGAAFIEVSKVNGLWTIAPDYELLAQVPSITSSQVVVVYDPATQSFGLVNLLAAAALSRTPINDAAYHALVGDRYIVYTAITAARIVTLPAAALFPVGADLVIADESGSCSATDTITIDAAGSDLISGSASQVITTAYGSMRLRTNTTNKWTVV